MRRTPALLFVAVSLFLPAVSFGLATAVPTVNVTVNGVSLAPTATSVDLTPLGLPTKYGSFTIATATGSTAPCTGCSTHAQVFAVDGTSVDKLALTNAQITWDGTGTSTLTITYFATFDFQAPTLYGESLDGTFSRGFLLASQDKIELTGTQNVGSGPLIGDISYTVPTSGSLSTNSFAPPTPPLTIETPVGICGECGEMLKGVLVVTFNKANDTVRLPGSARIAASNSRTDLEQALTPVPEPASWLLLASGLGGLVLAGRTRLCGKR
jgi:PEP-CTERM motif-containing protein